VEDFDQSRMSMGNRPLTSPQFSSPAQAKRTDSWTPRRAGQPLGERNRELEKEGDRGSVFRKAAARGRYVIDAVFPTD
jgi:hypothetical protein